MNCSATSGRIPMCDAPAAAPTNPASEIGVSITRCSPYLAISPSVTLVAPPYAPMSSPMQKTLLSRSISSKSASRIASRYVISAIERPPSGSPLVLLDRGANACAIPQWLDDRRLRVDSHERIGGLRRRRLLGHVGRSIDLVSDPRIEGGELLLLHLQLLEEHANVAVDRIVLLLPLVDLTCGDVRLIVVLRVSLAAIGHELDQRHTFAAAGTIHGIARHIVRCEHVVAIRANARNTVGERLVLELLHRALLGVRRGVRVAVVLDDHHERAALHRREVDALVECAGRRRAIAHVHEAAALFAAHLEGKRCAGHHRHHVAQLRDLADEAAHGVAEMDVQLASARGRVAFRHVLANDLERLRALDQHRAKVAYERAQDVAGAAIECERAAAGSRLLPQRAKEAADNLRMPVEMHEPLLERAR